MKSELDNISQEELDEMVHDAKQAEASGINNGGKDAQIAYLRVIDPFQHLTGAQAWAINQETIRCRVNECVKSGGVPGGYLWNTVRDLVGQDDTQTQLESISTDPEEVKNFLGFDPWRRMSKQFTPEHLCARQIMQKHSDFEICSIGLTTNESYLEGLESGLRSMKAFGLIKDFNMKQFSVVPVEPNSTVLLERARAALMHANFRLNEIQHHYLDTDFKGIRLVLEALEAELGPIRDRFARSVTENSSEGEE